MTQLNSTPQEQEALVTRVLAYRHPALVARLERKLNLSHEQAKALFEDTKRFLALSTLVNVPLAPSPVIDDGWHEFLMYTEDYQRFCRDCVGKFIHHRPTDPSGEPEEELRQIVENTLSVARATFGALSANWSFRRASADCSPDVNCESAPSDCATNVVAADCSPDVNCESAPSDCATNAASLEKAVA